MSEEPKDILDEYNLFENNWGVLRRTLEFLKSLDAEVRRLRKSSIYFRRINRKLFKEIEELQAEIEAWKNTDVQWNARCKSLEEENARLQKKFDRRHGRIQQLKGELAHFKLEARDVCMGYDEEISHLKEEVSRLQKELKLKNPKKRWYKTILDG